MNDFVAYLVKNLVEDPQAVQVQLIEGTQGTIIEVKVAETDLARVIGRQGRTIKALRTIVMVVGARFGRRIRIEILSLQASPAPVSSEIAQGVPTAVS